MEGTHQDISPEQAIKVLIKKIYKDKKYPDESDLVISEEFLKELYEDIKRVCALNNVELKMCPECRYCYYIIISQSKNIPLLPDHKKGSSDRSLWLKRYGRKYYQMYIAISRLGKFSLIYWNRHFSFFFIESEKIIFDWPSKEWEENYNKVVGVLIGKDIKLVPASLISKRYPVQYENKITKIIENSPSLIELLFTDELH